MAKRRDRKNKIACKRKASKQECQLRNSYNEE
nr:MAG TPA: hypothetical protein [Caudoviricetes sp.]